ncbi:MAG: phosphocarrier protein HPr [Acidobacteriota bacterium]|nr:phosphocarrier protein HPr [Acidobacteriota bacterium]
MVECRIRIVNRLGLHARAAAKLVRAATAFSSTLKLVRLDRSTAADAKSILSVLMLAAALGTELLITAEGPDEGPALDALRQLIGGGFGETEE